MVTTEVTTDDPLLFFACIHQSVSDGTKYFATMTEADLFRVKSWLEEDQGIKIHSYVEAATCAEAIMSARSAGKVSTILWLRSNVAYA